MKIKNLTYTLTQEEVGNLLADLCDIQAALSPRILNKPKDSDGTIFTIGDLLEDQIEFLRGLRANEEQ